MAQATSIRFGKSMILLGNGAGTEVFAAPCGIEELSLNVNIETANVNIPDCDNPDLAAWLATDIVSQQMTLTGSGLLDMSAMQVWQGWWFTNAAMEKNVRFFRDLTSGNGGGRFQAPAVLTAYSETAARGNRWRNSFTIALNGKPTFTPAV